MTGPALEAGSVRVSTPDTSGSGRVLVIVRGIVTSLVFKKLDVFGNRARWYASSASDMNGAQSAPCHLRVDLRAREAQELDCFGDGEERLVRHVGEAP
jgi:hypothetical protein